MTISKDQAVALRRPFAPESIGKLPKPLKGQDADKGKCAQGSKYSADGHYCGGWHARALHLDYVGHAATTDRLLAVDPEWSWEPFAFDEVGLPAFDAGRNLWIKLTICGVTRIGVGDGKSAKECIGDAIRNAAMRFGVALDLWAKEDLVEFAQSAQTHQAPAPVMKPDGPPLEENQMKRIHILFGELDVSDRDKKLKIASWAVAREVASTKDLTKPEAVRLIDYLVEKQKEMKA